MIKKNIVNFLSFKEDVKYKQRNKSEDKTETETGVAKVKDVTSKMLQSIEEDMIDETEEDKTLVDLDQYSD